MVTCWGSSLIGGHLEEQRTERHLLTCLRADGRDRAGERRLERQLHLHRLQYAEPLSLPDSIPLGHVDREHGAGHRGSQAALTDACPGSSEGVGAFEEEALPLDHDL